MANNTEDVVGICCLKSCNKDIKLTDARADMRAFPIDKKKHKVEESELNAKWGRDGVARFHQDCWRLLQECKNGTKSNFKVGEIEKLLIKESKKHVEYHDGHDHIILKARKVAKMFKERKYPIAFTGAGISTAAGIGDFRGIFGKWTENEKLKNYGNSQSAAKTATAAYRSGNLPMQELRPTYTHEAIVKLMDMGLIKFLISQNTDGLHVLSGVGTDQISELHGNAFMELCEKCGMRFPSNTTYRNGHKDPTIKPKPCDKCRINHRTGRRCPEVNCNGCLMNTIINFGDYLEWPVLDKAQYEAEQADMVLALGTTLQVSPANSLVECGMPPTRLIICNRQTTPYDDVCTEKDDDGHSLGTRVYGDCDVFMKELMSQVLSKEELESWEGDRPSRMNVYDKRRKN